MKAQIKILTNFFIFLFAFGNCLFVQRLNAQNESKNTVRLSVSYVKIMNGEVFFELKAISKINKKSEGIPNINLQIYNQWNDTSILLGESTTDMDGKSLFELDNLNIIKPDSTNLYNIKVFFEGNDSFKKASKSINFKNADIYAKLITKDSINYVTAELFDKSSGSLVEGELLTVQVQRLFKPLKLGKKLNFTDENGSITVPIEEGIPGIDGVLTFEIVLSDHDDFGTIKALIKAPIGIPIVEESTFDERTMWSPRNKTPIFLLVIPNILTFGIWGFIIYLVVNLFKIQKSKN